MPEDYYGKTTNIEQWIADALKALTYGGEDIFKTAEIWKYQLAPTKGGVEAFARYAPFAFVVYDSTGGHREGDYDLRQAMVFNVAIGFVSKADNIARVGDADHLGCDKARDLVIAAIDKQHPGDGFDCDDLFYVRDTCLVDLPKKHAIQIDFACNQL